MSCMNAKWLSCPTQLLILKNDELISHKIFHVILYDSCKDAWSTRGSGDPYAPHNVHTVDSDGLLVVFVCCIYHRTSSPNWALWVELKTTHTCVHHRVDRKTNRERASHLRSHLRSRYSSCQGGRMSPWWDLLMWNLRRMRTLEQPIIKFNDVEWWLLCGISW